MRADRLVAALLVLQRRERVTAAELAEELEVSVPTARRDLDALAMAGVPVYSQPGRGGGWSLVGGARTDLSGLTSGEVRALFTLAGPAAALDPAAKMALRKLVQALPGPFRDDAEAVAESSLIDPLRWGQKDRVVLADAGPLQRAIVDRRRVRITYRSREGTRSTRVVDPYGLVDRSVSWYLVAGTERGRRTFRLDRMDAVEVIDEHFEMPEGFSLSAEWQRIVDEIENRRATVTATVLVGANLVDVMCHQFGRHCVLTGSLAERTRLEVSAPNAGMLADQLAGWGDLIEVTGPEEVRTALARLGRQLVDRYEDRPVEAHGTGPRWGS